MSVLLSVRQVNCLVRALFRTSQTVYLYIFDLYLFFLVVWRACIEGTETYGAALTRFLIKNGVYVVEVNRPDQSKRRLEGKSDPLDAGNAAGQYFQGAAKRYPKCSPVRVKRSGLLALPDVVQ
ncbi:hypothetical protein [Serratia ureilytica]|uniref:hypothetical protein n=1 Tax=Serratia ureilytica TaxID=300181 RepID=UPI0039B5CE21